MTSKKWKSGSERFVPHTRLGMESFIADDTGDKNIGSGLRTLWGWTALMIVEIPTVLTIGVLTTALTMHIIASREKPPAHVVNLDIAEYYRLLTAGTSGENTVLLLIVLCCITLVVFGIHLSLVFAKKLTVSRFALALAMLPRSIMVAVYVYGFTAWYVWARKLEFQTNTPPPGTRWVVRRYGAGLPELDGIALLALLLILVVAAIALIRVLGEFAIVGGFSADHKANSK